MLTSSWSSKVKLMQANKLSHFQVARSSKVALRGMSGKAIV